jgi:hypothetical protein
MKRYASVALLVFLGIGSLAAQTPKGWMVRADNSKSASDPDAAGNIKFMSMGTGFHATNPQAAVYWNPANVAKGNYSLKGTFTLMKPSGHTNYYGLVFGGSELDKFGQTYLYFMVAQDGTWLIKKREGDAITRDVAKMANAAVKTPDSTGKAINALEVRVTGDKIEYLVNGTTVHTTPKTGLTATTDGIYGIRVNHQLEVHIDGFGMSKI